MDRREFLRQGLRKVGETSVKTAGTHARQRAAHWIRPPYALDELEFLLACTRCGDCIDACPHQVIFPLSARLGAQVVGTPALDLLNKGCHLCADWPCVAACEPDALKRSPDAETEGMDQDKEEQEKPMLPRIAIVQIDTSACLPYLGPECGACAGSCPVPSAMIWEADKPRINPQTCTGCGLCREACIVEPKAVNVQSLYRQMPD